MSHCTDEDKNLVRDKTDKLLQRYNKLRDQANDKRKEAEDAAKLSEDFFDAKDQLIAWCDETASKLEAVKEESENVQQERLKVCDQGFLFPFSQGPGSRHVHVIACIDWSCLLMHPKSFLIIRRTNRVMRQTYVVLAESYVQLQLNNNIEQSTFSLKTVGDNY